jgi:hypothetical protein
MRWLRDNQTSWERPQNSPLFDQKIEVKWAMEVSSLKISGRDQSASTLVERLVEGKLP